MKKSMKKTHWLRTTLITLVACGIAGLILAIILFNANPGRTGVSSSIEFSFDGAAEGVAPNGQRFDVNDLTSDAVLAAALEDAGLSGKYTADQLRANMIVSGVYPKDIVQQMTGYQSLLTGDASRVTFADYHPTLYNVTLYNDFDKTIARADLEKLLDAVMRRFRENFEKVYSVFLAQDAAVGVMSAYDYTQQLDILETAARRYETYAESLASEHPDFLVNGEGFSDLAAKYASLRRQDLDRLSGLITMNAISKDRERLIAQYENEITVLEIRLAELNKEAKETREFLDSDVIKKDDIIYVSTSEKLQQVSGSSSQTYDTLMARRRSIESNIAALNKQLAEVKLKLADIVGEATTAKTEAKPAETKAETTETGTAETAETAAKAEEPAETAQAALVTDEERAARMAIVEKNIAAAAAKLTAITDDFASFLQQYSRREIYDSTVAVTAVKYNTPKILSGSFLKTAVKTAAPFCAVGLIVCLVLLIISRCKEGKAKA